MLMYINVAFVTV